MNKKLLWFNLLSGGVSTPWWLGGGLVPESTDYVIYDPLDAADQSSSYINLANPGTKNFVPGVAPSWSAGSGWSFNGSTQYGSSQQNPANESTLIVWVEEATAGLFITGATGTGNHTYLLRPINSVAMRFSRNFTNIDIPPALYGGVMAMTKNNAYINGVKYNAAASLAGSINFPLYIGCENNKGTASSFGAAKVFRWAYYNFTMTDAQVEAVSLAMLNYNRPAVHSYSQSILALNPDVYYPMNEGIGHVLLDHSGNKRHGEAVYVTPGVSGSKGNAVQGSPTSNEYNVRPNYKFITDVACDLDNFFYSQLIYVDNDAANNQIRFLESLASGANLDYFAGEIRNIDDIALYLRQQTVQTNTGTIIQFPLDQWVHLCTYHYIDGAEKHYGIYVNGTQYDFTHSLSGYTTDIIYRYPYICGKLKGRFQHVAFWNQRQLTPAEVASINPF